MRQSFAWETTSILSNHLGPPLDFNTGQKNESRLGNLGAQNGLFLVFLCNYFLSSYCRKKSEGQQYTSAGYQLSNKELVSWSLSSTFVTKPLSFILYCHCNLCLASLSFLFSNRPLCMPHNFKLFKT